MKKNYNFLHCFLLKCFFLGKPSAPENLQVKLTEENSITLEWMSPSNDGGAPVLGYVVEKQEVGADAAWEIVSSTDAQVTQTKVPGLEPEKAYSFRLILAFRLN